MFGYILPCRGELKVREWGEYRSYYCGLCKTLKQEYGFTTRMLLNYDFVYFAMLADSLHDATACHTAERCIANPLQKRCIATHTEGLRLAADCLVLSAWHKISDDIADEGFAKRVAARGLRVLLKAKHRKAQQRLPRVDEILASAMQAQNALEARHSQSIDEAADPTAQMTGAIFASAAKTPTEEKVLFRLGMFIGKTIYYLDAAEDFESDLARGGYNVFIEQGLAKPAAVQAAGEVLRMCAGEAALCYNLLECGQNKEILDNILFLGLPQSIAHAGEKRAKMQDKD